MPNEEEHDDVLRYLNSDVEEEPQQVKVVAADGTVIDNPPLYVEGALALVDLAKAVHENGMTKEDMLTHAFPGEVNRLEI